MYPEGLCTWSLRRGQSWAGEDSLSLSLPPSLTPILTPSLPHPHPPSLTPSLTPSLPPSPPPSLPPSPPPSLPPSLPHSLPHPHPPTLPPSLTPSLPHSLPYLPSPLREPGSSNPVTLHEVQVSKCHVVIRYSKTKKCFTVIDLGSQNGTLLNQERLSEASVNSINLYLWHTLAYILVVRSGELYGMCISRYCCVHC